jgi:hypothetical protein
MLGVPGPPSPPSLRPCFGGDVEDEGEVRGMLVVQDVVPPEQHTM